MVFDPKHKLFSENPCVHHKASIGKHILCLHMYTSMKRLSLSRITLITCLRIVVALQTMKFVSIWRCWIIWHTWNRRASLILTVKFDQELQIAVLAMEYGALEYESNLNLMDFAWTYPRPLAPYQLLYFAGILWVLFSDLQEFLIMKSCNLLCSLFSSTHTATKIVWWPHFAHWII